MDGLILCFKKHDERRKLYDYGCMVNNKTKIRVKNDSTMEVKKRNIMIGNIILGDGIIIAYV